MDARVGLVTGRETAKNRGVGRNVRLLQVQVTDASDVQTVQLVEASGEESNPPLGSLVVLTPNGPAYKTSVSVDDGVEPIMDPGGKRIYSTDENVEVIADIQLKPDGTIVIDNPGATITVSPAGVVTVDSPTVHLTGDLNVDGTITAPNVVGTTDVTFGGKSGVSHIHGGVEPGAGNTGAPV